jgi:phytoene dehydrogenase-like protein
MRKKALIIGGGVAGLSAGIYGQLNGYDTEIIEMHTQCGGQCTAWSREGYRFDHCLHWLVGTSKGPFHDVWKETNVLNDATRVVDHEVFLEMDDGQGEGLIVYTDLDRWEKYLVGRWPGDTHAISKMCSDMRKGSLLEPFADPPELRTFGEYLRAARRMLPALRLMMRYRRKTSREYLAELNFNSPRLLSLLTNLYGENDFSAVVFLLMFSWFNQKNAGYLIGGSLSVSDVMKEKYLSLGGKLRLGKKVTKILVGDHKAIGVLLDDGSGMTGDYVISAADGHSTLFDMLDSEFVPRRFQKAYAKWPLFTPIVQVSFGIDQTLSWTCPVRSYRSKGAKIGSTVLDSGYTIMNYSFDPTMAPAGKTVLIVRYESPWAVWKDLKGDDYQAEKQSIGQDATVLLGKHFPGITRFIEVIDISTPLTETRLTGVWKGAYEGFFPSNKTFYRSLPITLPGLDNFYLAGQWLTPGGGLPPSALSGKWVFQLICRKDDRRFVTTDRPAEVTIGGTIL